MIKYAKIPHTARLLLTGRCNLNCKFCLNNASDASAAHSSNELTTDEWLILFKRFKELLIFKILLSGGEIFLRKDLFILLERLRENRVHSISLLTNGTLISREIAQRLKQLKIKLMAISIDGLQENHDRIRGGGTFEKSMAGIEHLLNAGIVPQVSFTPVRDNYKDLAPLIDLLAPMGIKNIAVNTLTPEGRCLDIYQNIVLEFPRQVADICYVLESKRAQYPDIKISSGLGFYYRLPETYKYCLENPGHFEKRHLKQGCSAASTSCTITETGDVIPCEGFPDFKSGNVRQLDLMEIWKDSVNMKKIRDLAEVSLDETPYCKKCKYRTLCDGGCRATANLVFKDLHAPSVTCPYWEKNLVVKRKTANPVEGTVQ